jgi:hypothetical protein
MRPDLIINPHAFPRCVFGGWAVGLRGSAVWIQGRGAGRPAAARGAAPQLDNQPSRRPQTPAPSPNPGALPPSRMTIGMLVESMAAKAGAMRGEFVDASPFQR